MTLATLLARKALLIVLITLLVATCSFWAVHLLPENLALQIAAARFSGGEPNQELADVVSQTYGLDRPILIQYFDWLVRTLRFDFGTSLVTGREVAQDITHHGVNSLRTVFWGFLAGVGMAVPIGYVCARFAGSPIDTALTAFSAAVSTIPSFLVAIVMLNYLPVVFMFLIYDVIVIEAVFNYHGLGWTLINAVKSLDIPLMQGLVLALVLFYLCCTTLSDLLTWRLYHQRTV